LFFGVILVINDFSSFPVSSSNIRAKVGIRTRNPRVARLTPQTERLPRLAPYEEFKIFMAFSVRHLWLRLEKGGERMQ